MGKFCATSAVLLTFFVLATIQYNDVMLNVSFFSPHILFKVSFLVLGLLIFTFGILSGALLVLSQFLDIQKQYTNLKKQYEKTTIGADDAQEKIQLLENKVATLEAALKTAMEK